MKQKKKEIIWIKKSDTEKLISDLKFSSQEDSERNKKDTETQTKRLEDIEKDLKEQNNQLKNKWNTNRE